MLDALGPFVITFVVLWGIAKAILVVTLLGLTALLFTLLDTVLMCVMGD